MLLLYFTPERVLLSSTCGFYKDFQRLKSHNVGKLHMHCGQGRVGAMPLRIIGPSGVAQKQHPAWFIIYIFPTAVPDMLPTPPPIHLPQLTSTGVVKASEPSDLSPPPSLSVLGSGCDPSPVPLGSKFSWLARPGAAPCGPRLRLLPRCQLLGDPTSAPSD